MRAEHTTESTSGVEPHVRNDGSVSTVRPGTSPEPRPAGPSRPVGSVLVACVLISVLFHSLNKESSKLFCFKKTKVGGNQN